MNNAFADSPHRAGIRCIVVAKKLVCWHAARRERVRGRGRGSRATAWGEVAADCTAGAFYGLRSGAEPGRGRFVLALVTRSPECSELSMRLWLRLDRAVRLSRTSSHRPLLYISPSWRVQQFFFPRQNRTRGSWIPLHRWPVTAGGTAPSGS